MSKFLIALGLVLVSNSALSGGMKFFEGSFDDALAEAKKQDKLLFVDVYTEWCGPCKIMAKEVFPTDLAGEVYNAHYVNFKLDAETDEGIEVTGRYPLHGFPTYWFLDGDGELLKISSGSMEVKIFAELGKEVAGQGMPYKQMLSQYDAGDRDPGLVRKLLLNADLHRQKLGYGSEESKSFWSDITRMRTEYLSSRTTEQLINADDFAVISFWQNSRRGQLGAEVVFDNYDEFANVVPEEKLARYVVYTNRTTVLLLAASGDESYKKYLEAVKTEPALIKALIYQKENAEPSNGSAKLDTYTTLSFMAKRNYLSANNDWKGFVTVNQQYIDFLGDLAGPAVYAHPARVMLGECNDFQALTMVEPMVRKAYADDKEDISISSTYGKLLAKLGRNEEAKQVLTDSLPFYTGRSERGKPEIEALIKSL